MASFFSTLFGGGAEREAADRNRAALGTYERDANRYFDTGLGRSTGAVTDAANSAGDYFGKNYGIYTNLRTDGLNTLDANTGRAVNELTGARDAFTGLSGKYGSATKLLLDAVGANGADAAKNATASFQTGPGYNFTFDTGIDALNRSRNARGMLNSGNTDIDALKFGTGLADQTWNGWLDRLGGFVNPELQATSGAAGVSGNIANVLGADSAARLGLLGTVAGGQAGANTARAANDVALGNTLSNLYTGDASNRVGVAGNVLSGNTSANNMQAAGEASGARNLLGAGMALGQMAVGAATGMPVGMGGGGGGGSGGGSSWFSSLFGGNGGGTGYATNPWSNGGMFGAGPPGASRGFV